MIKFDKKFVYFMWSDDIKDKKCFVADYIGDLKDHVERNDKRYLKKIICISANEDYPFNTKNNLHYSFCYYDPYYELKVAIEQGKVIQRYCKSEQEWEDHIGEDFYDDVSLYRIKPDEPKAVTCCELAQWLAKGNGEWSFNDGSAVSTNYVYNKGNENNILAETIRVRKWGDTEWHKPYREYLGLDKE